MSNKQNNVLATYILLPKVLTTLDSSLCPRYPTLLQLHATMDIEQ